MSVPNDGRLSEEVLEICRLDFESRRRWIPSIAKQGLDLLGHIDALELEIAQLREEYEALRIDHARRVGDSQNAQDWADEAKRLRAVLEEALDLFAALKGTEAGQ